MKQIFLKIILAICFIYSQSYFVSAKPIAADQSPVNLKETLRRVVSARVYHNNNWTLGEQSPSEVGQVLASLQPTYVSGLIYLDARFSVKEAQMKALKTIQSTIKAQSPYCKFDFTINPNQFKKPEEMVARMQALDKALDIDIWYLDFVEAEYNTKASVVEAAIAYAHKQGQLIGGNELDKSLLKAGDFVAFYDAAKIDLDTRDEMKKLKEQYGIEILLQINNDSGRSADDTVHTFIKKWSHVERLKHIKRFSKNQFSWKYRLMYPIYFPVFLKKYAYDAAQDRNGEQLKAYLELMELYNSEKK